MNDYIIEIKNLYKAYKNGVNNVEVLKGINLKISRGKFVCIQGPSGAGKSTLLNLMGTLDKPDQGEVLFEGKDVSRFNEKKITQLRNERVGFVFQFYHLLPEFSALENVVLPALIKNWWQRGEVLACAKKIFSEIGLMDRMQFMPNQLSGGEQQRVAIARALINKPDVLLCDEPTGNLDSQNGLKIIDILKTLSRENNTTVVLVTHNREIARVCDEVAYLKDGRLQPQEYN